MIYAISNNNQSIKFGRSRNVPNRVEQLRRQACWPKLAILARCDIADEYERVIHHYLARDRISGEWFKDSLVARTIVGLMRQGPQALASFLRYALDDLRRLDGHGEKKQRWGRRKYNGYQRELMRGRRARGYKEPEKPSQFAALLHRYIHGI